MRKPFVCLAIAAYVSALSTADAAYVIKLKNGNEFVTGRYWQDGKQIMFDTYGGVFGVDKAFVVKIERSDKPVKLASAPVAPADSKPAPEPAKAEDASKQPKSASEPTAQTPREDDPILKDFNALKEKFNRLDGMLTSEMIQLSKDISSFKRKVQTSGNPNAYLNEFTEAFKMGHALEAALKSRGQ